MEKNSMIGDVYMNKSRKIWAYMLITILTLWVDTFYMSGQDKLPQKSHRDELIRTVNPARGLKHYMDTISYNVTYPISFVGMRKNEIADSVSLNVLMPILEQLRLLHIGASCDTVRIVHIGDSHIRGHIFPRRVGEDLSKVFGSVSYTDMGVNGATCLTFTHPDRINAIASLKPDFLILSFGTNESHNRAYNSAVHYHQMDELIQLLRDSLPNVPMMMTTPPGSYVRYRIRRRKRKYVINPRTSVAVQTICKYAATHNIAVWDMYHIVGGEDWACKNWLAAHLMRPDHIHFLAEGYMLQGDLLYEAIVKAYNYYVSH